MLNKRQQEFIKTKLKTQEKTMTLHQIKTDLTNLGKICLNSGIKIQFGKPVKLPLIKRKKQQLKKTTQQCYSSRSNQNKSQLHLRNNLKEITLQDDQLQTNPKNFKNDRSSSFLNKLVQQQNLKCSLKDRSLDATKMNLSAVQQSDLMCTQDQKIHQKKCLPKIFRYKYFKDPSDKIQRINSQRNVMKFQQLQIIPKYRLGSLLGQGSYATVRLGKGENNQLYAIKTYQKSKLKDNQKKQNIRREIEILSKINHPAIIKFIEVIQTNLSINIVTQLIENISLYEYIKSTIGNRIAEKQAKVLFRQIAQAIKYIHDLDIAHRDIKLQNILITKDEHIKIIDFGFSTQQSHKLHIFCGTPSYISPQIISKKGYYAKPADIWSLGIVLYKMLCGSFPFKGLNEKTLYNKISKGSFRFNSQVSLNAQILMNRMLVSEPSSRITIGQILESDWLKSNEDKHE